jgi:hypothetical protein
VTKFELYKHNDELFNIYYRIFYELWTFAYFDRLCKLEKRVTSSWLEVEITGHNFGRGPSKDHSAKVWLQLAQWFLRRRFFFNFIPSFF